MSTRQTTESFVHRSGTPLGYLRGAAWSARRRGIRWVRPSFCTLRIANPRRTATAMGVVVVSLACAATAAAEPARARSTAQSRVFVGGSAYIEGRWAGDSPTIDGNNADEQGGGGLGLTAGYSHVLKARWLLLLGVARYTAWGTIWSRAAGESRERVDVAIGPQVYLPLQENGRLSVYFALPAGGTIAWIEPGPHRAISESYDTGYGFNYGATAGLAWHPAAMNLEGLNLIVEGSFLMHPLWVTHRAQTLAPPIRSSTETYKFDGRGILLTIGAELWL